MKNRHLFLFLFFCLIRNTTLAQNNNSSQIKAVQLISTYPFSFHQINGEWVYSDTTNLFFRNDTIMFRTSTIHIQTKARSISAEDDDEVALVDDDSSTTSIEYKYFIYKKGSDKGLWFKDTVQLNNERYYHPDSVMDHSNIRKFETTNQWLKDSAELSETIDSAGISIMKYVIKGHQHRTGRDSVFIYLSDRFRDIDFSLSETIEKELSKKFERLSLQVRCDLPEGSPISSYDLKFSWQLAPSTPYMIEEASRYFAIASRQRQ